MEWNGGSIDRIPYYKHIPFSLTDSPTDVTTHPADTTKPTIKNSEKQTDAENLAQTADVTTTHQSYITEHPNDTLATKTNDKTPVPHPELESQHNETPVTHPKLRFPPIIVANPDNIFYHPPPASIFTAPITYIEHYDHEVDSLFYSVITEPEHLLKNECDSNFSLAPSETFTLFSQLDSRDLAFDCQSLSTNLTALHDQTPSIYSNTPYRFDKMHVPCPYDFSLDPIHHIPFLRHQSELNSRTNPQASLLFYADATIHDKTNGDIVMRDLPTCVDASNTVASFCIHYLHASPFTKTCIRDLTTSHLRHLFRELHPILTTECHTLDNHEDMEYIQALQHSFNRATNLVMDSLTTELRSKLDNGIPSSYLELITDYEPDSFGHECALAILYAFKMLHLCHFLICFPDSESTNSCQPPELSDIIRNIPSFATALRLFPNRSNFRDIPSFINSFFLDQEVATIPFDKKNDSKHPPFDETPPHLASTILSAFTHSPLVNGFGNKTPTDISPQNSDLARSIISCTLEHHAKLQARVNEENDLHLHPSSVIVGKLPPADMLLNHFCSAFPIVTVPTEEQLNNDPEQYHNPANTLAVNFAICKEINPSDLKAINTHPGMNHYACLKSHFEPIATNVYNHSIDFLPDKEYRQFRVVKNINVCDPQCVLPQTPLPKNVLIYQGTLNETKSYTAGSTTKIPTPKPGAHTFPIVYNSKNNPIIFHKLDNNGSIEPYNSTTVQSLFTPQACIPMNKTYNENPRMCPDNPSQLWNQASPIHFVTDDPFLIPISLAIRLIQVITTKSGSTDVYRAWALPHLEDALTNPYTQIDHNSFSFFWLQHVHPEYDLHKNTPPVITLNVVPDGESCKESKNIETLTQITHNTSNPPCHRHNDVIPATEQDRNCEVIRYQLDKQQLSSTKHTAFLAVRTRSSITPPETMPGIEPNTPIPTNPNNPTVNDELTGNETQNNTENSPAFLDTNEQNIDTFQNNPSENTENEQNPTSTISNPLQRISQAITGILTPKSPPNANSNNQNEPNTTNIPPTPTPVPNPTSDTNDPPPLTRNRPQKHPTFVYPPIHETFFDDDTDSEDDEPPQIPIAPGADDLTSSTRTDFSYPPVEELTRTLLKYAKNANLRKLTYPTDLALRRRQFNAFMDNLRIVCNISPYTRQVFDQWPKQISYSHPFVGTAIYNLIFTNVNDPCQKHIIDGPPDARIAILTLRRHCAPLTADHIERTREAFQSVKQGHQEVATSYLNRIRVLTRDCYHAGIPNTDAEIIKRAIRGGSNHQFYSASYQRFDADIRRAELNDEELPPFSELESHLLNIDESRGLTLPSQNQRNFNQHANAARHHPINSSNSSTIRNFSPRQQQALSSTLRSYTSNHNNSHNRSNTSTNHRQITTRPRNAFQASMNHRPNQHNGQIRRPPAPPTRPNPQQNRSARPPLRPTSNNNHRRPAPQNSTPARRNPSNTPNAANVVCNNCGRLGHYARQCPNANSSQNNRGNSNRSNNENTAPRNQRAYFITESTATPRLRTAGYHHQAFLASANPFNPISGPSTVTWPDESTPQMEINEQLLSNDFLPTTAQAPPNTGATEYFPDDPTSPHQCHGPPHLDNWLPDSGATCHYTPIFSDLCNVEECNVPVSLADGTTKISTHKGTTDCFFTTCEGQKSILGLTDVYYIEGLSHRLLSLTAISATQNFTVMIKNRATTICFPNNSTYTWPLLLHELPSEQAFSTIANTTSEPGNTTISPDIEFEQHVDTSDDTDTAPQPTTTLPLEIVSRRLAHRNFRNLMTGSLHNAWNDHTLSPATDTNTWPIRISISQKRARRKVPLRQGTEPFHQLHLDLMRNPFRFGLTTSTNFSAYLFIVTTPGKLTGWIGLQTESTSSILTALQSWLTQSELLGRTQSVRFIRTDAGTAFTSAKFITACTELGIKVEAAAPEHQEMNGICEAKWREIHNTANTLLNTARLGGAFFHHAHAYAVHIVNSCPAKNVTDSDGIPTTPFNFCYGRKPSLANFRVFGCPVYFKRYEPTFNKKLITYKQQLQRASRGIFIGFPENSAGWLVYSPDHPQRIVITRDAYFDENFSSALAFDSKPFAGAIPIRSHLDPNGLQTIDNSEPSFTHQTGSAANLGIHPSSFIDNDLPCDNQPPRENTETDDTDDDLPQLIERPPYTDDDDTNQDHNTDLQPGPIPPMPHMINLIQHQKKHTRLQKDMTLYFQECAEPLPSLDPIQTAMLAIDASATASTPATEDEPVDKYLPEPQSLKAVLKLDDDVRSAWLHAIRMEVKNLIDHDTFTLGEQPRRDELIVPVKLVLKAKQTATGKLEKLKARLVARGDMEKRRLKKTKAHHQQQLLKLKQEIAESTATSKLTTKELKQREQDIASSDHFDAPPHILPIAIPEPFEDTWSPCASSRGVKLLLSTICASRRTLKSADFIGAYLQAKVIGRHFVKLPLEYAYHFPEYAKYFGIPLLLNKGIYGLVYSGKYWNIEFSEWLYSQGFIQSQAEPSYFVRYDKHNQWLRLLFFVDDMLYAGSNDSIEKHFEDSVRNRFDVKFLGPAQWFLQMRIHQHKDSTYTLDQHRYVLNTLQRYDPDSEFPERDTPFPPDYVFSKDNRPVTEHDKSLIEKRHTRLPFRSAVCTLLYLAYNTRADILFAVCKLAKACISPGETDFRALIWLIGYLRKRPSYALKFYPDGTSNPIYDICRLNRIPYSDIVVFSDASWQDCPDTGRSTVGYLIFHHGALIEANSTMPTPVAMSTSEAEYLAACSAAMATAHIRMLLYDMTYLGTKQWRESSQRLPTTPSILMIDNEATVQIAKNGKLTRKTRHIERRFHFVRQGQQDGTHQLHWITCESQLADILTKSQTASKIDPHLAKIFCILPEHLITKETSSSTEN